MPYYFVITRKHQTMHAPQAILSIRRASNCKACILYVLTDQDIDNKDITRLYHMDLDFEFVAFIFKSLVVV